MNNDAAAEALLQQSPGFSAINSGDEEADLVKLLSRAGAKMVVPVTTGKGENAIDLTGRAVHRYPVPASIAAETGITHVDLVPLSNTEELLAASRGTGGASAAMESVKQCIVRLNKEPVGVGPWLNTWFEDPRNVKLRTLIMNAHAVLNNPKKEETADFLANCEIVVG